MQDNHGPFNAATAPTGTAWPAGDDTPSRTHDHWRHLLGFGDGDGDGDGKTTLQHINEFKAEHGEAAYVRRAKPTTRPPPNNPLTAKQTLAVS